MIFKMRILSVIAGLGFFWGGVVIGGLLSIGLGVVYTGIGIGLIAGATWGLWPERPQ